MVQYLLKHICHAVELWRKRRGQRPLRRLWCWSRLWARAGSGSVLWCGRWCRCNWSRRCDWSRWWAQPAADAGAAAVATGAEATSSAESSKSRSYIVITVRYLIVVESPSRHTARRRLIPRHRIWRLWRWCDGAAGVTGAGAQRREQRQGRLRNWLGGCVRRARQEPGDGRRCVGTGT